MTRSDRVAQKLGISLTNLTEMYYTQFFHFVFDWRTISNSLFLTSTRIEDGGAGIMDNILNSVFNQYWVLCDSTSIQSDKYVLFPQRTTLNLSNFNWKLVQAVWKSLKWKEKKIESRICDSLILSQLCLWVLL